MEIARKKSLRGSIAINVGVFAVVITPQVFAQKYMVPPSDITTANVPVISDEAMERCVKSYNKSIWLENEIKRTVVNEYSQTSIDSYNANIERLNDMTDAFNRNCAGKQSASAAKAAKKLNESKK